MQLKKITTFVVLVQIQLQSMQMKNVRWVTLFLLALVVLASSCTRRKDACAAYNRTEIPQVK